MIDFEFNTTPTVMLREKASHDIGEMVHHRFGSQRVFIVTDANLLSTGIMEPALTSLRKEGIDVVLFDKVIADPPEAIVTQAIDEARFAKVDCVIGFGGGSPMDAAKVVAQLINSSQSLNDIYGVGNVFGPRSTPLILVPTTAGTGSEVTPISILTTGETTKAGIVAPQLFADLAVLDPTLTLGLPAHITAATGIDAMVHAFEAYTSRLKKNPFSDMLARNALGKLYHNIRQVCENGGDLAARSEMMLGAMMAGQAFANAPVAAVHALAYPVGGIFHVPHGLSNSLVMPHILRFNLSSAAEHYAELAHVIDPGFGGSTANLAEHFIDKMQEIAKDTGIPTHLAEVGIKLSDVEQLTADAMKQTRLLVNNPREVTIDDAREIYKAAL